MLLADDLNQLLDVLPTFISDTLHKHPRRAQLIEIVLDLGRRPEARFSDGTEYLSYRTIVWQDLDYILKRLGKFSGDNRAGVHTEGIFNDPVGKPQPLLAVHGSSTESPLG